jgi:hypothetical protein
MRKVALIVDDSRVSRMMLSSLILAEDRSWPIFEAAGAKPIAAV